MSFSYLVFGSSCCVSGWNVCAERLPKKNHPWETSTTSHLSTTVLSTKNGSVRSLFEEKQILNQKLWRLFFTRSTDTLPKPYIHSKTTSRRDWGITGRYLCWSCWFVCYLYVPTVGEVCHLFVTETSGSVPDVWKRVLYMWSQRLVFFP